MAGTLTAFLASFTTDLARPSRFDVSIPGAQFLTLRCDNAELPSRTFSTAEQKIGSNPIEKYPYHSNYNDASMTFIVSDSMVEKLFFDGWMEKVNPLSTFNFKYKNTYVKDIIVTQYSVANKPTYSVKLKDAYPISINQLDLDWSSDSHHKLTVTFAYSYWQIVDVKNSQQVVDPNSVAQAFPVNMNNPVGTVLK